MSRPALAAVAVLALAAAAIAGEPALPHVDAAPTGPGAAERLEEIRRRVQAVLVYPPIARSRGRGGESVVSFAVGSAGAPEALALERSSGSDVLDAAALRAVRDAAPLPRMIGRVSIPVRFAVRVE